MANERIYNTGGTTSSIGGASIAGRASGQLSGDFYFQKMALIEARKEQYFSQLADTTSMPKNMGKKIKRYHYLPMLDDVNLNDQGIDAAGLTLTGTQYFLSFPSYFTVPTASAAAAVIAIHDNVNSATGTQETGIATVGAVDGARTVITMTKTNIKYATLAKANVITAYLGGAVLQQGSGNMYGSSKDIGTISGKMPALSEMGGRVNRVGFKRKELEGTLEKFGFFDEYTQESLDFDSDSELMMHINREMINGANEITEDALQVDLLTSAGVVVLAGSKTLVKDILVADTVVYADLMKLSITLDNNRTPKNTTVITGTRMIDTKTLPASRIAYIGSELLPTLRSMKDLHLNPAFIPVQQYAASGNTVTGEVGSIDNFRFVVVPEMMKWAGAGGAATGGLHYETNGRVDVFPILVVGSESFTTIGFQTDGKSVKFKIYHKAPGEATADRNDPYGETGFMSIKWYYGFMVLRGERIAVIKTAAKL